MTTYIFDFIFDAEYFSEKYVDVLILYIEPTVLALIN